VGEPGGAAHGMGGGGEHNAYTPVSHEHGLRIYYGRIYAPLKLVQTHFDGHSFPVPARAEVFINGK
jgi:hypothetical protein